MTPADALKTPTISSTDRLVHLSQMRVIACLGIVMLHTTFAACEYFADTITAVEELASRAVVNNMMWAVPCFVMVTGVLQLNPKKPLSLEKLFGKYIFRIAAALIACCLVFRAFDMLMDEDAFTLHNLLLAFKELLTGRTWGHLWYLYLLIGLYVLMPLYRAVVARCSDRELIYLCGAYFLFVSIIPMIESLGISIAFYISETLIYPLYLFLGYMIHEGRLRVSGPAAYLLVLICTAAILAMNVGKYSYGMEIPSEFFGYASPFVILQTTGLFALLCGPGRQVRLQRRIEGRIALGRPRPSFIPWIDSHTFGIYLIHMVFIRLVFRYWNFDPYAYGHGILILVFVADFFILSFAVTWLLRKIPGVKRVL